MKIKNANTKIYQFKEEFDEWRVLRKLENAFNF